MKNILFLLILLTGFFASSAVQTQLADKVIIGRASSADKTIGFNHDLLVDSPNDPLSVLKPSIKLNRLTGTLQTSNNGADFRNLNVYSGIGETNLLENSGFEMYREFGPSAGFYGWLGPGSGIFPISGSNVLTDSKSLRFNGTYSGEYLYSIQYTIPKRLYGRECLAKINYTTGAAGAAAKVYLEVYNGSGLFVAGPSPLSEATSTPKELKLNFTCPSSGTIGLRVTSAGNSLYHYLDDAFLGEAATAKSPASPTIQRFTSGSGTYTTPINVKYIRVRMVGGGGGGAGGGTSGTGGSGGTGGTTTFGSSLLTTDGGTGGSTATGGAGGSTSTVSAPAVAIVNILGGDGSSIFYNSNSIAQNAGATGAYSPFGGAGRGSPAVAGRAAVANTGSGGGGGGGATAGLIAGGGGGSGSFLEATISSPSATYSYAVGAAGTAGSAGTSGAAGGAGGSGVIIVEEYY